MSQFAPSWDKYNPSTLHLRSKSNPLTADVPSLDCQVAELTWEKRQLAMYGLGPPHKPTAGGNMLVPWLDHRDAAFINPALDALVPCDNSTDDDGLVGSCSGGGGLARPVARSCKSYGSATATCGGGDSRQVTLDSSPSDREFGSDGLTPTSLWSPENTSSGEYSFEDHDSVFRSGCTSQRRLQAGDKGNRKGIGIGISAKSRAAAVHNQSERGRRDKINERMKTLQKLVPNSSKTDKASMLDEVIEYLKQLQAQVHMMSRMNMLSIMNMMMMPLPMQMQQHLLLSFMPPSMGMSMGMGMDINAMAMAMAMAMGGGASAMLPMMPNAFMPCPDFLSTFFASQAQSRPMTTVDAYSRMAALYQQFQQSSTGSKY